MDKKIDEIFARQEITDILHLYARGFDRFHRQSLLDCFFPDSTFEFGDFSGSAAEFVDAGLEMIKDCKSVTHQISNIEIVLGGDCAAVECNYLAYHRRPNADNQQLEDYFLLGRYVDEFRRRDDQWRIKHRIGLQDCQRVFYPADSFVESLPASYSSQRYPDDQFYTLRQKLGV